MAKGMDLRMLLAGVVIGAVLALISFMSLGVNPLYVTASQYKTWSPPSSATINTYVDTTISPASVDFGSLDPGTENNTATNNPVNITNTLNSNTVVDIYVRGSNLTNDTSTTNITFSNMKVNALNSTTGLTSMVEASDWLNGTIANSGFHENVAKGDSVLFWFFLDVPVSQDAAVYSGTITIKSVKNTVAPGA